MSNFSAPALSAGVMAAVRIVTMIVGPYVVAKGWVEADQLEGILVQIAVVGVAVYGLWKTIRRQQKINSAERVLGPIKP